MAVRGILLCLGAVCLFFFLREKLRAYSLKAALLKSLCSVLFIALAVCSWYRSAGGIFGVFVIMGLVFGLLGDIWLDLKYVFPEQDELFTYAGFAVFGIGHALYIAGLLLQYGPGVKPLFVLLPLLLGVLMSFGNAVLEKPMKLRFGKWKPVVIAYGVTLFSTLLLSGSLALQYGRRETTLNLFFAGALLFAISDLILSGTYFGEGHERPVDIILNYLSYYPAQFLIALSLYYLH